MSYAAPPTLHPSLHKQNLCSSTLDYIKILFGLHAIIITINSQKPNPVTNKHIHKKTSMLTPVLAPTLKATDELG